MKRYKYVLIYFSISILFGGINSSFGQFKERAFKHINTNEGLSYFTVFSIAQDHNGFMWFGTMDGLNRFDGESIKVYRNDPKDPYSLGNSYIWSLLCTSDSSLWVGTNHGLFYYNRQFDNFSISKVRL